MAGPAPPTSAKRPRSGQLGDEFVQRSLIYLALGLRRPGSAFGWHSHRSSNDTRYSHAPAMHHARHRHGRPGGLARAPTTTWVPPPRLYRRLVGPRPAPTCSMRTSCRRPAVPAALPAAQPPTTLARAGIQGGPLGQKKRITRLRSFVVGFARCRRTAQAFTSVSAKWDAAEGQVAGIQDQMMLCGSCLDGVTKLNWSSRTGRRPGASGGKSTYFTWYGISPAGSRDGWQASEAWAGEFHGLGGPGSGTLYKLAVKDTPLTRGASFSKSHLKARSLTPAPTRASSGSRSAPRSSNPPASSRWPTSDWKAAPRGWEGWQHRILSP